MDTKMTKSAGEHWVCSPPVCLPEPSATAPPTWSPPSTPCRSTLRLGYHTDLMKMNGITVQGAMAVSALSALTLAALTRGRVRVLAATAGLLTVASFLITRFGNVPVNGHIKQWAATAPPADHAEILSHWKLFDDARTCTAAAAFAILISVALRQEGRRATEHHFRRGQYGQGLLGASNRAMRAVMRLPAGS
ncbi:DUF1772 domain-containing protein [Streptomyces sp. NPDC006172]|uniref:DUF1772 domain-containing protein n=1 Tax=Streptomyces sp. NPDC006172 TaxID=3154470 RepID=UPI0033D8D61C